MSIITVSLNEVCKTFGRIRAVDRVSFEVKSGEIFGLLGPNGAGKTSIIRLILNIIRPDAGEIAILGGSLNEARLNRIGYLPEERGLYQEMPIEDVLLYLARLKGIQKKAAQLRMTHYLSQMDLLNYRRKKIKELSKGMQQKVQVIATLLHEPQLLILDEPFSALDPFNTQMVKDLMIELKNRGVSIILSTHQLNHAEELCDRIFLVNRGKKVLYGNLADQYRKFSDHAVTLQLQQELPHIPGVINVQRNHDSYQLSLSSDADPQEVLNFLVEHQIRIDKFEVATPSLEQIFIRSIKES